MEVDWGGPPGQHRRTPLVVAIVINFNYGRYLGHCLASIDALDYERLRVIVVDDGSTDESREVIERWSATTSIDHDVILKTSNRGPAHSYNAAIARLTDEDAYVQLIDADDTWHRSKIVEQVTALERDSRLIAVYSDTNVLDEVTGELFERPPTPVVGNARRQLLEQGGFIPLNAALIRATALRTFHIDETLRLCDFTMWVHLSNLGGIEHLPGLVGTVRSHGGSMTHTESLTWDRLRILGAAPKDRGERRLVRLRCRPMLKAAAVSQQPPKVGVITSYAIGAHDLLGFAAIAARIPPVRAVLRRLGG